MNQQIPQFLSNDAPNLEAVLYSAWGEEKKFLLELETWARGKQFSEGTLEDLKTIFTEACLNAMEHGNLMCRDKRVWIRLFYRDPYVTFVIMDEGSGNSTEWIEMDRDPFTTTEYLKETRFRGWGLMMIKQLSESIEYLKENEWQGVSITCRLGGE